MTLLIGIEDPQNNRALLCADSGNWRGSERGVAAQPKVGALNGWLYGIAGSRWQTDVIQYELPLPELGHGQDAQEQLFRWAWQFAEACSKRGNLSQSKDSDCGFSALVAHDVRIWHIDDAGGVCMLAREFQTAGAAQDVALGALAALSQLSPLERVKGACRVVTELSEGALPPWNILGTDGYEERFA